MEILGIAKIAPLKRVLIPLFSDSVHAGFPSPAEDFVDSILDLNELIIEHPLATFFVRAKGDSMYQAGIRDNDILVVDRSLSPKNRDIVIATLQGEFTCKYFIKNSNGLLLHPANPKYRPIPITESSDFTVWGVVTFVLSKKN
jgi:DNA polymerase V